MGIREKFEQARRKVEEVHDAYREKKEARRLKRLRRIKEKQDRTDERDDRVKAGSERRAFGRGATDQEREDLRRAEERDEQEREERSEERREKIDRIKSTVSGAADKVGRAAERIQETVGRAPDVAANASRNFDVRQEGKDPLFEMFALYNTAQSESRKLRHTNAPRRDPLVEMFDLGSVAPAPSSAPRKTKNTRDPLVEMFSLGQSDFGTAQPKKKARHKGFSAGFDIGDLNPNFDDLMDKPRKHGRKKGGLYGDLMKGGWK